MRTSLTRRFSLRWGFIFLALTVQLAQATELPGQMSMDDIGRAGRVLGFASNHRTWTAPALVSEGLGLDLGLESTFIFRGNLEDVGNGQGVIPRIVPVPRLWAAWDLPADIQASFSLAPGWLFDGVTAVGFGGQWVFFRDESIRSNFSGVVTYTFVDAFDDLRSHLTGFAAQVSRDMETWQPYAGAGVLIANSTVKNNRQAAGVNVGPYTLAALHVYVGLQLNFMGKFSAQIDLANREISAALLLAQQF